MVPEANLVLLTGLFGARANARVPTRRAGKHACTGLVHLDAKFRIRRSILGKFRSNFDLEGHTGREFEWYEYLGTDVFGPRENIKLAACPGKFSAFFRCLAFVLFVYHWQKFSGNFLCVYLLFLKSRFYWLVLDIWWEVGEYMCVCVATQ